MIARYRPFDRYTAYLKRARELFLEQFGFPYNDKLKVDREILRRFNAAARTGSAEVTLPFKLVLALTLREGFAREANRPGRSTWEQRKLESAIRNAHVLKAHYKNEGLTRGEATERALTAAAAAEGLSRSVLRDRWGRSEYRSLRTAGPTHRMSLRPSRARGQE